MRPMLATACVPGGVGGEPAEDGDVEEWEEEVVAAVDGGEMRGRLLGCVSFEGPTERSGTIDDTEAFGGPFPAAAGHFAR